MEKSKLRCKVKKKRTLGLGERLREKSRKRKGYDLFCFDLEMLDLS